MREPIHCSARDVEIEQRDGCVGRRFDTKITLYKEHLRNFGDGFRPFRAAQRTAWPPEGLARRFNVVGVRAASLTRRAGSVERELG